MTYTLAELSARPELWSCDPVKAARRLAKFRTMPLWQRRRAMELILVLMESGRMTRL